MKDKLPALIFHLLPLIPLAMGYPYAAVAAALLVTLAYIKVQKLRADRREQIQKHGKAEASSGSTLEFWERLTLLPKEP